MKNTLPDFGLEVHFAKWEFAAQYHLTASDAESMTISELLALRPEGAEQEFLQLSLGYTPTWGTPVLLEAISRTYQTLSPEHVLTFAGAEEGMFWALQELLEPGDHAIVTVPNYQAMEDIPLLAGADVEGLVLRPEAGWRLDIDAVTAMVRPNTRLIAVNFPQNPTGAMPDPPTWCALGALCEERGIRLFSDEVYRGLELNPDDRLPQAADLTPTAISLNVMSKSYGLPGLRVGWLACRDRALLERLERRKHYTSICNAGPSEFLAAFALSVGDQIHARNRSIIEANLPVFADFFARWADRFEWQPPQGGCVAYPRLRSGENSDEFCRKAVEDAGVLLLPSSVYASRLAATPTDRFRIGVGRRNPQPGLAALDDLLSRS